jgi:hypothetical protein
MPRFLSSVLNLHEIMEMSEKIFMRKGMANN